MKPDEPMLMIETTPSQVNWAGVSPLKRPGVHRLGNLLAVSRGSEGVCYFQFRSSRGSSEKYHGTVVSHDGREDTRVFREVAEGGALLDSLKPLLGSQPRAQVAIVYDYQNIWTLDEMETPVKQALNHTGTCIDHYAPMWKRGVDVDVVDQSADLARYKIVIVPMLQMLLPGTAQRLSAFVANGGILVTTYLTGYVNETDLCFQGGFPGPLRELLGVRIEEIDALPSYRTVPVTLATGQTLGMSSSAVARDICELLHAESAEVLATYACEFYAGMPAITRKATGRGMAYHLAARLDQGSLDAFTARLLGDAGISSPLGTLPTGVTAQTRTADDGRQWLFLMNFNEQPVTIAGSSGGWQDVESGGAMPTEIMLAACGSRIFARAASAG